MAMGEAEYLDQRLDDQINWYGKKSAANQTAYKRLRLIEIIAAAAIPLPAVYSQETLHVGITIGVVIGVIGLMVAVLAGIVSLYRFQENWNEYRAVAESLKQEDTRRPPGSLLRDGNDQGLARRAGLSDVCSLQ